MRIKSGQSRTAIVQIAWATTATAATFNPRIQPAVGTLRKCTPYANAIIRIAEGAVNAIQPRMPPSSPLWR